VLGLIKHPKARAARSAALTCLLKTALHSYRLAACQMQAVRVSKLVSSLEGFKQARTATTNGGRWLKRVKAAKRLEEVASYDGQVIG
jgi:hypothetical protein